MVAGEPVSWAFDKGRTYVAASDGSAYVCLRPALEIGNELLVDAAAWELPGVALDDALCICLVLRDGDTERYQRAAVRWWGASLWRPGV